MCDYCGCRRSGPTAELAAEDKRLRELADVLDTAVYEGTDATVVFDEFNRLLQTPEQCDEIELAHRAVEAVWDQPDETREAS